MGTRNQRAEDTSDAQEPKSALQRYWWSAQQPGDVLFTFAGGAGAAVNVFLQWALTGEKAEASHVILCVAPGLYAHSVIGEGVHFQMAEDLPIFVTAQEAETQGKGTGLVKAVRPKGLATRPQSVTEIVDAAGYFIGQKYNGLFFAKRHFASEEFQTSSAFCSELVAAVFDKLGMPLSGERPEQLLPADLKRILAEPDWDDVTDEYEDVVHLDERRQRPGDMSAHKEAIALYSRKRAFGQLELIKFQLLNTHAQRIFQSLTDALAAQTGAFDQGAMADIHDHLMESAGRIAETFDIDLGLEDFSELYKALLDGVFAFEDRDPIHFTEQPISVAENVSRTRNVFESEAETLERLNTGIANLVKYLRTVFPAEMPQMPASGSMEEVVKSEAFRQTLMMAIAATSKHTEASVKAVKDAVKSASIDLDNFLDRHKSSTDAFKAFVQKLNDTNFLENNRNCADDIDAIASRIFLRCMELRSQIYLSALELRDFEKVMDLVKGNEELLEMLGLPPQRPQSG